MNRTALLATVFFFLGSSLLLRGQELKFSGGALSLGRYDYAHYQETNYGTGKNTEAYRSKLFSIHWAWLDADIVLNDKLSFSSRISNISVAKMRKVDLDLETDIAEIEWVSFQYAYIQYKEDWFRLKLGLIPIDMNIEPLEVLYTPWRTSWTSFIKATLGNIRGISFTLPLDRRGKPGRSLELEFHVSTRETGTGKKVIQVEGQPEERIYDLSSQEFYLNLIYNRGPLHLQPIFALRTNQDGNHPATGKGNSRIAYGFTGRYLFSKRFTLPFGLGVSSFSNERTRALENHVVEDNSTLYFRAAPTWQVRGGRLILDCRYSRYVSREEPEKVVSHFPVVTGQYVFTIGKHLNVFFPRLRFFGEFVNDRNARLKYTRYRLWPEIIAYLEF